MQIRYCEDCKKPLKFEEFCRDNPSMSKENVIEFWSNGIFSIHCPKCFFNRPERPFKLKRGYHSFILKRMRTQENL